jgi:SAM-dependent methyltransferase
VRGRHPCDGSAAAELNNHIKNKLGTMTTVLDQFLSVAQCPVSGSRLQLKENRVICCVENSAIEYRPDQDGIYSFVNIDQPTKYDNLAYVKEYLTYSYGAIGINIAAVPGVFVGRGTSEGLYRTTSSLVFEALESSYMVRAQKAPFILFLGCGVGRSAVDAARLFPNAAIVGLDLSLNMIRVATRVVCSKEGISISAPQHGFENVHFKGFGLENVLFLHANAAAPPLNIKPRNGGTFDLVVADMIIDRMPSVNAIEQTIDNMRALLKVGGRGIITTACNWISEETWAAFGVTRHTIVDFLRKRGFKIWTCFDDVPYHEALDKCGSRLNLKVLCVGVELEPGA